MPLPRVSLDEFPIRAKGKLPCCCPTSSYTQMLEALSAWPAKAESQWPAGAAEALLATRLAPDMFPLATQVRFACVQAQEGVFRLRGQEFPHSLQALLEEGRDARERPGSIADAQARIVETLALVEVATAEGIAVEPATLIAHSLPIGMTFDLTGE